MTTRHPRSNIALDPELRRQVADLARRRETSSSAVAAERIRDALERSENTAPAKLAARRERGPRKTVPPDKAWSSI